MSISAGIKSRNGTGARRTSDFRSGEKSEKTDQEQKDNIFIAGLIAAGAVDLCGREKVDLVIMDVMMRTNEEIAQRLGITVNTVRYHIQNLLNKTGFENRLSLAVNAKVLGIVVNENDRQHFLNK